MAGCLKMGFGSGGTLFFWDGYTLHALFYHTLSKVVDLSVTTIDRHCLCYKISHCFVIFVIPSYVCKSYLPLYPLCDSLVTFLPQIT